MGQNVIFDYSFLKQWAVNHKRTFERNAVDTLKLARKFLPQEQKKDLASLCSYFGIERVHAHRALDDVMETQQIFEQLQKMYEAGAPEAFRPYPLQYKVKKQPSRHFRAPFSSSLQNAVCLCVQPCHFQIDHHVIS